MGRKQRIWFKGAKYHVTSRGIRKTTLFFDDEDRIKYLFLIKETMNVYPFNLQAYCIMTNHIHLQIETLQSPTFKIMKHLHTGYAKYFNNKYGFSGHVFEARYGAELIDSREYELDVSKYIHLNPVKANIVERPEDYRWSSYPSYVSKKYDPLLQTKQILSYFPEPKPTNYQEYVNSPYEPYEENTSLYKDFYVEILKPI